MWQSSGWVRLQFRRGVAVKEYMWARTEKAELTGNVGVERRDNMNRYALGEGFV